MSRWFGQLVCEIEMKCLSFFWGFKPPNILLTQGSRWFVGYFLIVGLLVLFFGWFRSQNRPCLWVSCFLAPKTYHKGQTGSSCLLVSLLIVLLFEPLQPHPPQPKKCLPTKGRAEKGSKGLKGFVGALRVGFK